MGEMLEEEMKTTNEMDLKQKSYTEANVDLPE